jgi:hypothetical protein
LCVCIFSYWIYVGPGCNVHLPLTSVGVCVDPVGVGQIYAGGVDGNIHVTLVSSLVMNIVGGGIAAHSSVKTRTASSPALKSIVALHVPSVGVAVMPPTVEGLHVDVGGVGVTVVLPS